MDISPREFSKGLASTRGGLHKTSPRIKGLKGCSGKREPQSADVSHSPNATKLSKHSHTSVYTQNQPSAKNPDGRASRKAVPQHTRL